MTEAASSYLSGTSLRSKVEINWGAGPFDEPTSGWTDVTADVLSVQVKRGRPSENQAAPPGSATIVFNDRDGSYDPTLNDLGGPNAPDVVPGRRVRMSVSDVAATIEALRPDFYFPLSLAQPVTATQQLVGVMEAGPFAYQRIEPSGTGSLSQRYEGQWMLQNGAFPTVIAPKPHALEDRNGTRIEQGAYIRTDCTAQFGTCSGVAWVNTQSTAATYFMGQHESFRVGINTSGKAVLDVWLDGQWEGVESSTTIRNTTQWHMVAWTIVWDVSTNKVQARLWVDGTFEAGGEGTGTVSTSTTDRIAVAHMEDDDTLSNGNVWDGELCDVAFWAGKALTDVQLERLWRMSNEGLPMFSGHVVSWQVEPRTTPIGNAQVVAECADVGQALAQSEITFDVRRQLLELRPDRLFTFDNDSFDDALGGAPAVVRGGTEWADRDKSTTQRIAPSTTGGVSDGALTLTAAPLQPAEIRWPAAATSFKAMSFWMRVSSPSSVDVSLAYGSQSVGGTLYIWWLQLNTAGRLQLFRQDITGSTVNDLVWEGERIITNDRWHFVMLRVSDVFSATNVYVDGVEDIQANQVWNVPVLLTAGPKEHALSIDEVAFWFNSTPSTATLPSIYEAGGNRYQNQTAFDRVNTICELAGWSGTKLVSSRADMRCGPLVDGDAWKLLQDTAVTEGGTAFVDADNRVVFQGRHDRRRFGALADSTLPEGGVANLTFTTDDRYLYNTVTVDGEAEAQDATSVATFGRRVLSVSPKLPSSTFRAVRAQGLVELYKDYRPRTDTLRWELPSMLGAAGLLVDLSDMVTVSRTVFPASASADYVQDCWVESYEFGLDAGSKRATVAVQLSPVDPRQNEYWKLGTSLLDGSDVLGW